MGQFDEKIYIYVTLCSSSDSFSHTKYISPCVENSENNTLMSFLFSNPMEKVKKARKTMEQIYSTVFSMSWLSPCGWRPTMHYNVVLTDFHTWWYIFCVWNIVRTTFWRIVLSQLRGDCSIMLENCMFASWWLIALMSADRRTDGRTKRHSDWQTIDRKRAIQTDRQTDIQTVTFP